MARGKVNVVMDDIDAELYQSPRFRNANFVDPGSLTSAEASAYVASHVAEEVAFVRQALSLARQSGLDIDDAFVRDTGDGLLQRRIDRMEPIGVGPTRAMELAIGSARSLIEACLLVDESSHDSSR